MQLFSQVERVLLLLLLFLIITMLYVSIIGGAAD